MWFGHSDRELIRSFSARRAIGTIERHLSSASTAVSVEEEGLAKAGVGFPT
jgi:hypothetical protein